MPIIGGPGSPEVPDWAPTLFDVADYVPHRTLTRAESSTTAGEDTYQLGFSETTRPTSDAVSRLLVKAVASVTVRLVPFHPSSEAAAATVACMWAAAWIERGWPEDDFALQRANDLEKRADTLMSALVESNTLANNDTNADGEDDRLEVAPVWSFPEPDPRYDTSAYF